MNKTTINYELKLFATTMRPTNGRSGSVVSHRVSSRWTSVRFASYFNFELFDVDGFHLPGLIEWERVTQYNLRTGFQKK
jgi:hypothetical protein